MRISVLELLYNLIFVRVLDMLKYVVCIIAEDIEHLLLLLILHLWTANSWGSRYIMDSLFLFYFGILREFFEQL
jgi:hypothetical protein